MKRALLSVSLVFCLFLCGCRPGTWTEGIMTYDSLEEMEVKFRKAVAFPTYYPEGFDPGDSGVTVEPYVTFTEEARRHPPRKSRYTRPKEFPDFHIFKAVFVMVRREPRMDTNYGLYDVLFRGNIRPMEDAAYSSAKKEYETIPGNQYGAEIYMSDPHYPSNAKTQDSVAGYVGVHSFYTTVCVPFADTEYVFSFSFSIDSVNEEADYAAMREEIRGYCIEEAMKMYESLAYAE